MKAKVVIFVFAGLIAGLALPVRIAHGGGDLSIEVAKRHFQNGQQLFDVGRWDEAAEEFEKAYAAKNDPTFLYNMAQAYRRKGDAKRALDLYKNYLIKAPESPQRAEVEGRIKALQKQLEEADNAAKASAQGAPTNATSTAIAPPPSVAGTTPTSPPMREPAPPMQPVGPPLGAATYPPPAQNVVGTYPGAPVGSFAQQPQTGYVQVGNQPPANRPGRALKISGIIFGATGLATIGAAIVFGLQAQAYTKSVQDDATFDPSKNDVGKMYETLQWVSYGVGGGLLATGAILYGIGVASANNASVAFVPLPGGAGILARGAF
jgi:tetratricopeptide (TPR) repeat protein